MLLKLSPPHPQLNVELKENLKDTMTKRYHQPGHEGVTSAVDKLQQEVGGWLRPSRGLGGWGGDLGWPVPPQFHCCGSNNSQDWRDSEWIRSGEAGGRVVPDSCCKTVVAHCGQRDHASNIYKVEVGGRHAGGGAASSWRGLGLRPWGREDLPAFSPPPPHPARAAASPSWRPSSRSTCGSSGPWASASPACRCGPGRAGPGRAGPSPGGSGARRCPAAGPPHAVSAPQVFGMIFTCCLYKSLKLEHY